MILAYLTLSPTKFLVHSCVVSAFPSASVLITKVLGSAGSGVEIYLQVLNDMTVTTFRLNRPTTWSASRVFYVQAHLAE